MPRHTSLVAAIGLSLALTPVHAVAGNGDAVLGIITGIALGAASQASKPRTTTKSRTTSSSKSRSSNSVNTAARQANRETQTALNYFGFNAGGVDGVLGKKSRSAITQFQVLLNYAPTGQLTTFERDFLIAAYYRAQSGGAATAQAIASNPRGIQGLLIAYRDEQVNGGSATAAIGGFYGLPTEVAAAVNEIAKSSDPTAEQLVQRSGFIHLADINGDGQTDYVLDTSVTGSAFWCNAEACAVRVFASTPEGYVRNDFQAFNVTPAMFSCQRGVCSKTAGAAPQLATNPAQPQAQGSGTVLAAAPAAQGVGTPVPTAQPVVAAPAAQASEQGALPTFFAGAGAAGPSLASHCNKVNLLTATNGGFVTAETLTDADFALSEQMCLARTYAISAGEELSGKVQGATPEQIVAQCQGLGPLLKDHVSAVSLQPREEVLRGVSGFVLNSGMSVAQLASTSKICLSVGYRIDDMDVAIGSALMLVALGETPYAELIGHHLSQGIGAARRTDLALSWYGAASGALQSGSQAVFAPGQPERTDLIVKATAMLGTSGTAAAPAAAQTVPVGLPLLNIAE